MKDKIAKLIDVKSIVTIILTIVFCVMSLKGVIKADSFMTIFVMVMTYFFTKKVDSQDPVKEAK